MGCRGGRPGFPSPRGRRDPASGGHDRGDPGHPSPRTNSARSGMTTNPEPNSRRHSLGGQQHLGPPGLDRRRTRRGQGRAHRLGGAARIERGEDRRRRGGAASRRCSARWSTNWWCWIPDPPTPPPSAPAPPGPAWSPASRRCRSSTRCPARARCCGARWPPPPATLIAFVDSDLIDPDPGFVPRLLARC